MLRRLLLGSMAVTLLACDANPVGPEPLGEVTANVQGQAVPTSYAGTGEFQIGRHAIAHSRPVTLTVSSVDRRSQPVQSLTLSRTGSELPTVGRYPIAGAGGWIARYELLTSRTRESYLAHTGELEITSVAPDRIEGSFHFSARRNCAGTVAMMSCVTGPETPDAPEVQVSGSFTAVRR